MPWKNTDRPRSWSQSPADLGSWLMGKWWHRLNDSGNDFQTVARQMRKQGYPIDMALAILLDARAPMRPEAGPKLEAANTADSRNF